VTLLVVGFDVEAEENPSEWKMMTMTLLLPTYETMIRSDICMTAMILAARASASAIVVTGRPDVYLSCIDFGDREKEAQVNRRWRGYIKR